MRHQRELNSNTKPDTIYNLILSLSFYKLYIWKLFLNANVKCNVKCNGRFHISNTCIQTNREKSVKKRAPVVNNEMPWTCLEKVEPFFTWMYQILFDMWTIENVRKFSKFVSFFLCWCCEKFNLNTSIEHKSCGKWQKKKQFPTIRAAQCFQVERIFVCSIWS